MRTRSTHTGALCVPTSVLCVVTVGTPGGHTGYSEYSHRGTVRAHNGTMGTLVHVNWGTPSTQYGYSEDSQGYFEVPAMRTQSTHRGLWSAPRAHIGTLRTVGDSERS